MSKNVLAVILILTHLLCIVLGYCIAAMFFASVESAESTTDVTETGTLESMTQTISDKTEIKEYTIATEETLIFTEATEESTGATEVTEATEAERIPVYTPSGTTPPATQPPATEPSVTQPPVTEPPATQPPSAQPPEQGSNDNQTPEDDL